MQSDVFSAMTRTVVFLAVELSAALAIGAPTGTLSIGVIALAQTSSSALDENTLEAAKLELMVLRASLPRAEGVGRVVSFVPDTNTMTNEQAAQALVAMEKPVICSASLGAQAILAIKCEVIRSIEDAAMHAAVVRSFDDSFWPDSSGLADQNKKLVIQHTNERLNLSLAAFRAWYHSYLPPNSVAFGHSNVGSSTSAGGSHEEDVVVLYHVDPIDPRDFPPELRFMIRPSPGEHERGEPRE